MKFQKFTELGPLSVDGYRQNPIEVIAEDMFVYGTLRVGNSNHTNFNLAVFTDYVETYAIQGFIMEKKRLTAHFTGDPADLLIVDLLRRNEKIARHDWIMLYSALRTLESGYMAQLLPFTEDEVLRFGLLWGATRSIEVDEAVKISCYNAQERFTVENVPYPLLTINWKVDAEAE